LFALSSLNVTTSDELNDYLSTYFFVNASHNDIDDLLSVYPEDPAQGSPFNTGALNAVTPQLKKIAAILGDLMFGAPRRTFFDARANKQDMWAFSQ